VSPGAKLTHSHSTVRVHTSLLAVWLYEYQRVILLDEKIQVHKIYTLIYVHIYVTMFINCISIYVLTSSDRKEYQ
jgi:hypothetical protein